MLCLLASCSSKSEGEGDGPDPKPEQPGKITLLQLNLWEECGNVENGLDVLTDQIVALKPDFATFCELYKAGNEAIIPQLIQALRNKGLMYYGKTVDGRAILSKYKFDGSERINEWMFKGIFTVDGRRVAVYSSHANYRYYACYLPRGYNDGSTDWNQLPQPITNVSQILASNRKSGRIESTQAMINNAKAEIAQGAVVFFAGDLNEPSHLDWQADTKNLFDHNGCVVNWDVSVLLYKNGYKDAYRVKYPNVVENPGFTFPADNEAVPVSKLSWAPKVDERDRIDFVYFYPYEGMSVEDAKLVGPQGSIVRGQRVAENTKDVFIAPAGDRWPTDHKGVLVTFKFE